MALSSRGGYLGEWKIPDPEPEIYSPEQLALSSGGGTLYATDLAANRVLVLRAEEFQTGQFPLTRRSLASESSLLDGDSLSRPVS